jgi:prophage regulatory protein
MEIQRIYRRQAVESLSGMKRSALYEAIAKGKFPKPVRVTERCVGWLESDILAWQAARIAERDEPRSRNARGGGQRHAHGRNPRG